MNPQPSANPLEEHRRRGIRRTAWILGLVAFAVFAGFLLKGMLP